MLRRVHKLWLCKEKVQELSRNLKTRRSRGVRMVLVIAEDLDQGTYIDVINFFWRKDTRIQRYWTKSTNTANTRVFNVAIQDLKVN